MARPMSSTQKATWKKLDQFFPMVGGGYPDATGIYVAATAGQFKLVAYSCNGSGVSLKNLTTSSTIYTSSSAGGFFSVSPPLATASVNGGDRIGTSSGIFAFAGYIGGIPGGLSLHAFAGRATSGNTFTIYTASQTTKIYLISLAYFINFSSQFVVELKKSTGASLHRTVQGASANGAPAGAIHLMQLGSSPYTVLNASESLQLKVSPEWLVAGLMLYE
jgi:hypothetical protein